MTTSANPIIVVRDGSDIIGAETCPVQASLIIVDAYAAGRRPTFTIGAGASIAAAAVR